MIQIRSTPVAVKCYVERLGNICTWISYNKTLDHRTKMTFRVLIIKQIVSSCHAVLWFSQYSRELGSYTATEKQIRNRAK